LARSCHSNDGTTRCLQLQKIFVVGFMAAFAIAQVLLVVWLAVQLQGPALPDLCLPPTWLGFAKAFANASNSTASAIKSGVFVQLPVLARVVMLLLRARAAAPCVPLPSTKLFTAAASP
jgi:hypothetical protein